MTSSPKIAEQPIVTPGDVMVFADEAFRNMAVEDLLICDIEDIQRAMQTTLDRILKRHASTPKPTEQPETVEGVTQADRNAAADMLDAYRDLLAPDEQAESAAMAINVRAGLRDDSVRVQAFMRHRLASHPTPAGAAMPDDANRITPEWCLNMARLEGTQEIGAGMPDHPLRLGAMPDDAAERLREALEAEAETFPLDRLPDLLRGAVADTLLCESEPHVIAEAVAIVRQAADALAALATNAPEVKS